MPICIEHVDDVRADAYTIELFRDEDGTPRGRVVPPTHRAARQPRSISSEVSPDQAIEIAVRLPDEIAPRWSCGIPTACGRPTGVS
jgi:hypothetical protein